MELKNLLEAEFPMQKINDYTDMCNTLNYFDKLAHFAKIVKKGVFICRRTNKNAHVF
jgi:hypothetical protein